MPVNPRSSNYNRVLNNNARAADVATHALESVQQVQARKYDAAFQVNGYAGLLYLYKTSGTPCACKAKTRSINARLNKEGKASTGDINQMLLPDNTFGVRPYAERQTSTPRYIKDAQTGYSTIEINFGGGTNQPVAPVNEVFDESDIDTSDRTTSGVPRSVRSNSFSDQGNLLLDEDPDTLVQSEVSDFDLGLFGMSDVSCPICFGSGFVGGFDIQDGFRRVLSFQDTTFSSSGVINFEKEIPSVTADRVRWTTVLPYGARFSDSVRIWNNQKQITGTIIMDPDVTARVLTKASDILLFCTGRPVTIEVVFPDVTEFTHLEIQCGQSELTPNFELPKLSKSSNVSLRERTDPFQVVLSPRIPIIKMMDVIVESTYNKVLQVKSVTGQNDRRYTTMGWEAEVRPCQPQELFYLLPRRRRLAAMNKPSIVRDNGSNNHGFSRT